jgi:cell division protein FtsQ
MANTESARRRGATPVAGKAKAPAAKRNAAPARRTTNSRAGAGAKPAAPVAPARDRFHALWGSGQLVALLGALGCGAALAYFLTAGSLQIRQIDLAGTALTAPETITTTTGVSGHNIFTIDPQVVASRLIALPTVREAQVWGELPDRLVVRVVERQPALVWQRGDQRFLLDESGFVIAGQPDDGQVRTLPLLNVGEGDPPTIGSRVDAELLRSVLTIGQRAPEFGVTVTGIEYTPAGGLTILTPGSAGATGGRRIVLGGNARLVEKLAVTGEVVRAEQTWTVLNVTDPDRPFFPAPQP